jgi:hypothetical protein
MSESDKTCSSKLECESAAVQNYLNILQSVISRMASNSASCKSWSITLVSAIIVVLLNNDKGGYVYIALMPLVVFLYLDSYYLAMEQGFRDRYNDFIKKLHDNVASVPDLFVIKPLKDVNFFKIAESFKSNSIFPFYVFILAMILIMGFIFQKGGS